MEECHPTSQRLRRSFLSARGSKSESAKGSASQIPWAHERDRGWAAGLFLSLCLLLVPGASAQRTPLRPGWNKFSPQEDITLGKLAASDAEKQLPLCNAPKVDAYLTQLGTRLAQRLATGGVQYP